VPAAAVIPAPIAYIKVVAVKKLVVGFPDPGRGPPQGVYYVFSLGFLFISETGVCSSLSARFSSELLL